MESFSLRNCHNRRESWPEQSYSPNWDRVTGDASRVLPILRAAIHGDRLNYSFASLIVDVNLAAAAAKT